VITLRDYQHDAIDGVFEWFEREDGNPLVVLPTGTGKSLVIAAFCGRVLDAHPDSKIICATHTRELISQNYSELLSIWPEAPAGINSAGIGRRDYRHQIIFCGVQSVAKHAHKFGKVDIILVDEAHMIPRDSDTQYGRLISTLKIANPYVKVVGLTATPYRLDSGRLDKGDGRMFDGIAYDYDVLRAVKDGYLSPLVTKATEMKLDVTGVGKRGGEYIPDQLQNAVDKADVNDAVVSETIHWATAQNRKAWLVFASGVDHAAHLCALIRARGYSAECITGETAKADRDRIVRDFKAGKITALCSMGVLTTGFNAPLVDLIVMARPTGSTGLYVQILGRGMRLYPGKKDALILDFARNIERHGTLDSVAPRTPGNGEGIAPVKECPECASMVHASRLECPDCGYVFPDRELKIVAEASALKVLSDNKPEWVRVDSVSYRRHKKEGKPDSMLVTYNAGFTTHREWVCFEHQGYAKTKAARWWCGRLPDYLKRLKPKTPTTVGDALLQSHRLMWPDQIAIKRNGKYTEIVDARGMQVRESGARVDVLSDDEAIPF
jgi:DNA repair protein RadD